MSSRMTRTQKRRLGAEKGFIDRYFPGFGWYRHRGESFVEGPLATNSGFQYALRVVIPKDYPSSPPLAYITSPELLDSRGRKLSKRSTSPTMHLLDPRGSWVCICHHHPSRWNAKTTIYKVILKARVWLEAYEAHLRTGMNIDEYLTHQEAS